MILAPLTTRFSSLCEGICLIGYDRAITTDHQDDIKTNLAKPPFLRMNGERGWSSSAARPRIFMICLSTRMLVAVLCSLLSRSGARAWSFLVCLRVGSRCFACYLMFRLCFLMGRWHVRAHLVNINTREFQVSAPAILESTAQASEGRWMEIADVIKPWIVNRRRCISSHDPSQQSEQWLHARHWMSCPSR